MALPTPTPVPAARSSAETAASRLRVSVADEMRVDRGALSALGVRAVALPRAGCVHLIIGPAAATSGAALQRLLPPAPCE